MEPESDAERAQRLLDRVVLQAREVGAQSLGPVFAWMESQDTLEADEDLRQRLAQAVSQAFLSGYRFGTVEATAQFIEQGGEVEVLNFPIRDLPNSGGH